MKSASGVESISVGILPRSSSAELISSLITNSPAEVMSSPTTNSKICICISPTAIASKVIVPILAIPSADVKPSGIINVTSTFCASTVPWLNTVTLKDTVSPGYTLSSSPGANVILDAKSNIAISNSSPSLSSSSPPVLSTTSSTFGSLLGSLSGVESKSGALLPSGSSAD